MDIALPQQIHKFDQLFERATQPVESPDHESVSRPKRGKRVIQTGPVKYASRYSVVVIDLIASCFAQRLHLQVKFLIFS